MYEVDLGKRKECLIICVCLISLVSWWQGLQKMCYRKMKKKVGYKRMTWQVVRWNFLLRCSGKHKYVVIFFSRIKRYRSQLRNKSLNKVPENTLVALVVGRGVGVLRRRSQVLMCSKLYWLKNLSISLRYFWEMAFSLANSLLSLGYWNVSEVTVFVEHI